MTTLLFSFSWELFLFTFPLEGKIFFFPIRNCRLTQSSLLWRLKDVIPLFSGLHCFWWKVSFHSYHYIYSYHYLSCPFMNPIIYALDFDIFLHIPRLCYFLWSLCSFKSVSIFVCFLKNLCLLIATFGSFLPTFFFFNSRSHFPVFHTSYKFSLCSEHSWLSVFSHI